MWVLDAVVYLAGMGFAKEEDGNCKITPSVFWEPVYIVETIQPGPLHLVFFRLLYKWVLDAVVYLAGMGFAKRNGFLLHCFCHFFKCHYIQSPQCDAAEEREHLMAG
jgi:hypothetical protein